MTDGNFWDFEVWSIILLVGVLLLSLLVAHILKQVIKPLRKSLIPASVLGGLILLVISTVCYFTTGDYLFNLRIFSNASSTTSGMRLLEIITYHCLGIGFVAMGMCSSKKKIDKSRTGEIFNSGLLTVSTYLLQAFLGLLITIIAVNFISGLLGASGIILCFGFGQGTGQALNYGTIYQNEYGFAGGANFGLTIAALGFLVASIFGVIYLNILKRKGVIKIVDKNEASAKAQAGDIIGENEIPESESMDRLSVQLAIVLGLYALSFALMLGLGSLFGDGLKGIIFGFNFLIGTLLTIPTKKIISKLRAKNVIKKDYVNDYMMKRISGFSFDLMIVAGIAAIRLPLLKDYWFVLLLLALVGAVSTYLYVSFISKKLFPAYKHQQFLAFFGMLTGTASTGMILLREFDTNFDSPASENLVYQNVPAIAFGLPMMFIASYAPKSMTATYITLGVIVAYFVVLNVLMFRKSIFKRKKPNIGDGGNEGASTETAPSADASN